MRAIARAQKGKPSNLSLTASIRLFWKILDASERRSLVLVLFMILILAFVEMAGVGSIMPFLAVAADPTLVETNPYLSRAYEFFGFTSTTRFLIFLGVVVTSFIVMQNLFTILVKYAKARFAYMRGHSLSSRLLATYLSNPYVFFLNQNSTELSKNVLAEVRMLVNRYITPLLDGITDCVVCISVAAILIAVDPLVASVVALVVGGLYGLIFLGVRGVLSVLGRRRLRANTERFTATMEALAGIKDVKLLGKERFFLERFAKPSKKMARASTKIDVIGKSPAFLLNAIVYGGIVTAITMIMALSENPGEYIPVIGLYVFAGSRLMPKVQHIFVALAKVQAYQSTVELIFEHFNQSDSSTGARSGMVDALSAPSALEVEPLPFTREISLENLSFTYPGASEGVIHNQSLTISRNTTIGLVGTTGCGKTTLVDIILGLLRPTEGRVCVDGVEVTEENLRTWQANLGYVPQSIYLTDGTITENIAFGIPPEHLDHQAVRRAAHIANLGHFIEEELPGGYDGTVGERGLRLSGGQRQRLGIARALYTNPDVLVMDEATSALDGMTESAIMEAIEELTGSKTIIIIAHRLATLRKADTIYLLDKGRIVARGSYEELLAENSAFQDMARVSE
ncbi:ABC-type bacteriocin/lantibiotic exporter, contains an N-terminal double-glycine peptidase domain [Alkalispirochaeta americana]|uniref:ABC-type bacteriocin/lantibiotic exporter, contains an N-terminal double-glycine peptidase domain n=1 Tax=Alkalispirochaeta americana TaxID=159291 RepID=A0A1N6XSR7_9SPIO|nr:ABC transporter ATP-binding protein [Alkalispirochaeta americana]SIR05380.1 ABC-type bacteriocin/lantibiotic exporter, contains an N-terminal double-glycine peptidase domain [Alkalispirochaeta americana]